MIEIGLTRSTYTNTASVAHMRDRKIFLGCSNMDQPLNKSLLLKCFRRYDNIAEIIEGDIENILTHEIIHVLLYDIRGASYPFDNIDSENEISAYHSLR